MFLYICTGYHYGIYSCESCVRCLYIFVQGTIMGSTPVIISYVRCLYIFEQDTIMGSTPVRVM